MRLFVTGRGGDIEGQRRIVVLREETLTIGDFAARVAGLLGVAVRLATKGYTLLRDEPVREVLRDGEAVEAFAAAAGGVAAAAAAALAAPAVASCGGVAAAVSADPLHSSAVAAALAPADESVSATVATTAPAPPPPPPPRRRATAASALGFVTGEVRARVFGGDAAPAGSSAASQQAEGDDGCGGGAGAAGSAGEEDDQASGNESPASAGGRPQRRRARRRKEDAGASEFPEKSRAEVGLELVGERAPSTHCWQYPLVDERRRSFAGYLPHAVSLGPAQRLMDQARNSVLWKQPEGTWGPIPRKTSWMTRGPCSCRYGYGGLKVEPESLDQRWMQEAMKACMPLCGLSDPADWPNSCNLNLYEDGQHSVGWHSDDERLFQGKFKDCLIISLSLGEARSFDLKGQRAPKNSCRMELASGDLCTMEGMTQKHYVHRVPKEKDAACPGPRVNLTWRWVVKHEHGCPLGPPGPAPNSEDEVAERRRSKRPPPVADGDGGDLCASGAGTEAAPAGAAGEPRPRKRPRPDDQVGTELYEPLARPPLPPFAPRKLVARPLPPEEVEAAFAKPDQPRSKWLSKALKQLELGQLDASSLFAVVSDDRFAEGLAPAVGSRMYRVLHANLEQFPDAQQRTQLERECALARQFAATAFERRGEYCKAKGGRAKDGKGSASIAAPATPLVERREAEEASAAAAAPEPRGADATDAAAQPVANTGPEPTSAAPAAPAPDAAGAAVSASADADGGARSDAAREASAKADGAAELASAPAADVERGVPSEAPQPVGSGACASDDYMVDDAQGATELATA
eukprot:TRINITY_DN19470_c4_g1_i1.p1 TRINITY_DN19470_c4_g1~~TRINITY_DN19470_c4_g1_i1.p1  ORF type:complete len:804 (-),score=195.57 TRINITY_DN19470_c4_g1_i1:295-2706(-)